jgi:acetyl-CoA carboxylase biotin carboxyl carrier protein
MAILGFELEEIARLLALMEAQDLDELIIEEEGRSLRLRGPRRQKTTYVVETPPAPESRAPHHSVPHAPRHAQPKTIHASANGAGASSELPVGQIALASPMVGVFYRSDKPGAAPFINVGEHVAVNQTIGIIEAMKVFSEVPADHAGTVVAIPAQDGQLVQAGTPLVILQRE